MWPNGISSFLFLREFGVFFPPRGLNVYRIFNMCSWNSNFYPWMSQRTLIKSQNFSYPSMWLLGVTWFLSQLCSSAVVTWKQPQRRYKRTDVACSYKTLFSKTGEQLIGCSLPLDSKGTSLSSVERNFPTGLFFSPSFVLLSPFQISPTYIFDS